MKNNSISKILAILLSCVMLISSNAVYVYAEPGSNVTESEIEELIAAYEEEIDTAENYEDEGTAEESGSEAAEKEVVESQDDTEEKTQSDSAEKTKDIDEQDLLMINSSIVEEYSAIKAQLKEDLTEGSSSESEIIENNEAAILDSTTEVCTGSRLNYIKKYIIANGVQSENEYVVSKKEIARDITYSMIYHSDSDKVEFSLLVKVVSSSGTVSLVETSFYAEDNAVSQTIFQILVMGTSPVSSYLASADVNPAEIKQDDVIDFSIIISEPESMRPAFEKNVDTMASLGLETLLLGINKWLVQVYGSDITIGNFGFLSYAAPATNHIWGNWVDGGDRIYRTCEVCGEIDEDTDIPDPNGEWKLDIVTGIRWKFSEGVLTVKYKGTLEYDILVPWDDVLEDVQKLVFEEGVSGFSENITDQMPNLKEVQIPVSCINIEDVGWAFNFNDNLEKIDVLEGNTAFSSVDGVLYNQSREILLFYPHNRPDKVFTLPDTCTEIEDLYSYKIEELNLGSNLKTINGFIRGENIVTIRVPATLQNIGGSVFDVSEKLTDIIIDESNPYLCYENYALLSKDKKIIYEVMPCINSTTYEIPHTVEEIFSGAFFCNNKIKNLIIPKNVKKIGKGAFARMENVEKICLLSTSVQFTGKPFSIVDTDEPGTFYVPNEYAKALIEGTLKRGNIKNINLIVDASLDVPGDELEESEPNDSFETAMSLPMGKKVIGIIGNKDNKDYYSISIEKEYAQTICVENFDNINGYLTIYDDSESLKKMCILDSFKYDADSNSYCYTFTVNTTGKYYICVQSNTRKEVPYGITYKNNSSDTSLDEEIAIESGKNYPKTVIANSDYMDTLKNYIKQHGEYINNKELEEKEYTITEPGKTANEIVTLEYNIEYDGTEWIWFSVDNYHNGLSGPREPYESLYFGWLFDTKYEFNANIIHYAYRLGTYSKTTLRTEIDIANADYGQKGCDFKFTSKNYSDVSDNEQLRKNVTEMYNDALPRWEKLLENAEGIEGFKFSDMVIKNGSGDFPSDDDVDNYSVYYTDQRTDLSDCTIATIKSKVYDGKAYKPIPKVSMFVDGKNKKLVYGTDYRLVYTNNVNVGQGTVRVVGIGKYKGSNSQNFLITGKNIGKLTKVIGSIEVGDTLAEPIQIYDGSKILTKGIDYEYEIDDSDVYRKGTAVIMVSALEDSNYTGALKVKFPVIEDNVKTFIQAADVTVDTMTYYYDGRPHTPDVTVDVNGTVLDKKDYSVKYKNNKNCGTACVIVKGRGKSYTGTVMAFFDIIPSTEKTEFDSVVVNKGKNLVYNGRLQTPKIVVKMNGKKLAVNKDYTLEYINHFNAGQGKVRITGIGNYEGISENVNFTIEQRSIKKASIRVKDSVNYTVKYAGKTLVEGVDYEVETEEISGTNKVNLKFIGLKNFKGEIVKKKVREW